MAYSVTTRTRELGLRLALGSDRRTIIWLVTRQALVPVAYGLTAGLALSLAAGRAMTAVLYDVSPHDPATLLAGAGLLLATTAGATAWPAVRAARLDPARALRE